MKRICKTCGVSKPLAEFDIDRQYANGIEELIQQNKL